MPEGAATGGGILGGLIALAYVAKLLVEAWKEARAGKAGQPTPVSDAAEASALLLGALQEERAEVRRLSTEVDELRAANGELFAQMQRQRQEYEGELQSLREQMSDVSARLEQLQARIRNGLPRND